MFFNVSGLIQEGIGATRTHDVEGTVQVEGRAPEQVAGRVEMLRTKAGVLVRAHLDLVEPEVCSRCLRPLEEKVILKFEEEFLATLDVRSGEEIDEAPDPDAFTIDENHMLDLTEAVRQYREVSLDMQPLCRPDCRGLCPHCGKDLNLGDCECDKGAVDDRWARLAALRPASGQALRGSEGKE
jgi:DUF177 domain-containing protein